MLRFLLAALVFVLGVDAPGSSSVESEAHAAETKRKPRKPKKKRSVRAPRKKSGGKRDKRVKRGGKRVKRGDKRGKRGDKRGKRGDKRGKRGDKRGKRGDKHVKRGKRGRKKGRQHSYVYTVRVRKGDTLARIAKRYKVRVADLRRWNRIRGNRVRIGQKLTITSRVAMKIRRARIYVVQRGDTLARIAKRLRTTVKELRRHNRIRRHLRIGQRLRYYSDGPTAPALSIGRPSRGHLVNGEQLPPGYGYIVRNPEKSYGTNKTISHIIHCVRMIKRRFRRAPKVVIGNLSRKGGGRLRPHKSHQSGRDVDIAYYYRGNDGTCKLKVVTPKTLDVRITWALMHCFLRTRDVKTMFVDYGLQKPLYQIARRYYRRRQISTLFQYPNGRGRDATIKHAPGHNHHFHVRFKCPRGNRGCVD
ncbi:MAG: penicillin-insensitive murein endopeptidase [Myxococcales bacterium]|nr:penicillin-insensitive murein endopeptidase [Myxococcales bacterium]